MFFYILSEHSQEECLLSVMPLKKKEKKKSLPTSQSHSTQETASIIGKGQLETHMSSPHIPSAVGERGERRRGWGAKTKEIVRKERKYVGESKTSALRLRTGEKTEEGSVKNKTKKQKPIIPAGPLHRREINPEIPNSPPSRPSWHFSPCKHLFLMNAAHAVGGARPTQESGRACWAAFCVN